jgi:hypothetical protein
MEKQYESSGTANLAGVINKKYYAGKLRSEVEKAKAYSQESGVNKIGRGIDYNKIYEKIPYKSGAYEPEYDAEKNLITIFRQEDVKNRLENWKDYIKKTPKEAEQFAIRNGYDSVDALTRDLKNPDYFRSVLEHEYGHPYSRGVGSSSGGEKADYKYVSDKYMADPRELANGLGRIQRETYQLTGRRFEDPNELKAYVESTPYEKGTEGYSEEAKRTWNLLYENKGVKEGEDKLTPLLDWSSKIAPALVDVNRRLDGVA